MKTIIFFLFAVLLTSGGCIPDIDDIAAAAGDECQRLFEEERPKIVAEIRAECGELLEYVVSEVEEICSVLMSEAIDSVEEWCTSEFERIADEAEERCTSEFERIADEAEEEIMTRVGCFLDGSDFGWNCEASLICE